MEKIQQIKELVKELNQYRHEYYNLDKPSVPDNTYDQKFDQLQKLELETGFAMSSSPTKSVGYEVVSKLQKVEHPIPLKSLDKTKSLDELNKWRKNKDVLLMLKADGLTVELLYENGELQQASTRGNAFIGEDILHNAKTFKNIPLLLPFKGKLRLSGEAIVHKKHFDEINSVLTEEDKYATPRNLCAGSVRQLNSGICAERYVYFYAFNILECNKELSDSKAENFKWLESLGFWTILNTKLSEDITEKRIDGMRLMAEEMGLPIDGLVVSFDSVTYSNSLQETSHHPLHSLAYKFFDESTQSVLRSVEWRTTRMGQVNPTAIFDTVSIDNTDVNRASLHNLSFIEGLQLNVGSRILVSKRNLIIPHIEDNLDRDFGSLEYPSECPACGGKTMIKNTGTADFLFCINDNCSAKLLDKFVHFVKRDCMNIEGLSSSSLELFINEGFLKSFDDIYSLDSHDYQIKKLEGWGNKSYLKLIEAIDKSRKVKCANLIYALGIPNVGKSSSKAIAEYFKDDFQAFIRGCIDGFDFSALEDFGSITSQSIHNWYKDNNEKSLWIYLMDEIEIIKEEKKEDTGMTSLEGKTFVVTGGVTTFKNRDEVGALITSLGGKLSGSVSKNTSYLLNNDITSTTGKNKKALELNVPIISEADFNKMIGRIG